MKWENPNCPECGKLVEGTLEQLQGEALVEPDGDGEFQYQGETKVFWDAQTTMQVEREDVLLCPNGHEWHSKRISE